MMGSKFVTHLVIVQGNKAGLSPSVQNLVESLEVTMVQHPLTSLRNMAYWALDCLLNALQVAPLHMLMVVRCLRCMLTCPSSVCILPLVGHVKHKT